MALFTKLVVEFHVWSSLKKSATHFFIHQLETKEFDAHFHAYEVNVPTSTVQMIFEQKNLKYYLPLHLINPCCAGLVQQAKAYCMCVQNMNTLRRNKQP